MRFPFKWINKKKKETFQIQMCCVSNIGKIRVKNEDNLFFDGKYLPMDHGSVPETLQYTVDSKERPIVAVFDGMGGECAGELASYTGAKALAGIEMTDEYNEENLKAAVLELNKAVCNARNERRLGQIGSTVVLFAFQEDTVWIGNLGDSPAFRLREETLEQISCPHTNAKFLEEQGIQRKPGLTQFLGIDEEEFVQEPYLEKLSLQRGDIYVLCSDGLTDMVKEEEMRGILLSTDTTEEMTNALLNRALENGGRDNITIILCRIM